MKNKYKSKNKNKNKSKSKNKYICYTGIGSNKTGTHTEKDFLKRMKKNKNNFNQSVPKDIKTTDQWIKFVGADKGKCKTKKQKFKLTHKKIKKICRKGCNESKKNLPIIMKTLKINKNKKKAIIDDHNKNCEKNCVRLMKDKKFIKSVEKNIKKRYN